MKKKFITLLFGLLLAVGWTSVASAQQLPEGGYAERLGLNVVTATKATKFSQKLPGGMIQAAPALKANAPTRAAYQRPAVVYPKAYYDTLMYTWTGADNVSHTDSATKVATEPEQIYELLRFVYMDPRFPGPKFNACDINNQAEDEVYYGGIDGGWNIPYGSSEGGGGSTTPVTYTHEPITITTQSWNAYITAIRVVDPTTEEVLTSWTQNTSQGTQTLPTGWTSTGALTYYSSDGGCYMGSSSTTGGSITISSNLLNEVGANHQTLRVYVTSFATADNTYTLGIANTSVSAQATLTTTAQNWYYDFTGTSSGGGTSSGTTTPTDVVIQLRSQGYSYNYSCVSDITISDGNTTLYHWNGSTHGANMPAGGYAQPGLTDYGYGDYRLDGGGAIRIDGSLFAGHNSITVSVTGDGYIFVCDYQYDYSSNAVTWTSQTGTKTVTINFPEKVVTDTYMPKEEGYTALLVQVKNNNTPYTEPLDYFGACQFTTKDQVIGYIRDNIKSVQLLTDGLRIGEGENTGTVYNCSGTYNKFFFLGKGRARKKSSALLTNVGNTSAGWPSYACEEVPFKFMYEQFSPTGGLEGDQITDFYLEMMDGHVYDVVHDCASVIQNGHQFSMSGNTGTQAYAMSGMNFFIPDYRLKYFTLQNGDYTVDGRDMNPYMVADANGKTNYAFSSARHFAVDFAQYNTSHAPKVGIYTLTLDAEAQPCEGYANPGNTNYAVTLDWTSSLNEMSGTNVPQTYVIYEVVDSMGVHTLVPIDTVSNTTHYDFPDLFPQGDHSVTHTYIIMGWPTTSTHPEFIAWSNEDAVVIPGLNDFLMLGLDHYESDFDVPNMQNWYRNFLLVNNDGYVGLTTQGINEGDSVFNLVRFENVDTTVTKQVAKLKFENQANGTVKYTVKYVDENGDDTQEIEPDGHTYNGTPLSYQRSAMGIVDEGYLTIKADGDIIIQPNGYDVNFVSIHVQAGNYNQTWNSSQSTLPTGWTVSSGSMWVHEEGAYYLEGGGYILIPASVIGNYTTATVTINAYGDAGKTAKIAVNGTSKGILNGEENARDYEWTINNGAKLNAPKRATTSQVTFTAGTDLGTSTSQNDGDQMTKNDVTISSTLAAFAYTTGTPKTYRLYTNSVTTISTAVGKITSIVFNGSSNSYINALSLRSGQPGTLSGSGSVRTWTGNASSVQFGATSQVRCTSIVVTIEVDDTPIDPTVDGTVRIANLRLVDQFNEEIPNANNHPYRYTYILKLANSDKESSYVPVPVQHTGAEIEGYYTHAEMLGDTDPANFLEENLISAELDMNLSPTSAPYYYTVNSVENGVPQSADEYESYLRVLQRRSAGDYQERQGKYNNTVVNPDMDSVYTAGEHDFFDYRKVVAPDVEYFLSYAPIVWTNGIARHYFVDDSLNNSYGAPIWEVRRGDVTINADGTVYQKQARQDATGNWIWNNSVNYTLDGTDYCLYFVSVDAQGILPMSNIEYEPYMFRLWLVDSTASLRNYTWELNDDDEPVKIVDAGAYTENGGMWKLLDTKMCENWDGQNFDPDLQYVVSIVDGNAENHSWSENLAFVGPMNGFNPKLYVRFYYKIKGSVDPSTSGMRGTGDEDNVGYVVVRGHNPDPSTAVREIIANGEVESVTYYNIQGMESDKPFDGINIVVTRYSNGATTTTKVRH